MLFAGIDTKVAINLKSNKTFWHTKSEMLKGKLQNVIKQKISSKQSYCCNMFHNTKSKQYGLQTEAATERCSSKIAIPELINTSKIVKGKMEQNLEKCM